MIIYNIFCVIKITNDGVDKLKAFPVIDEQLSGEALGEAIECFKEWVKEVIPDIDEDELEDLAKDERFDSGGFVFNNGCIIQIISTNED